MGAALPHCLTIRMIGPDQRNTTLLTDARALGIQGVERIEVADLVFIDGACSPADLAVVASDLVGDPLLLTVTAERGGSGAAGRFVVETALLPGVTDARADALHRGARVIGLNELGHVATGHRYEIVGEVSERDRHRLITRLLVNPVIERHAIGELTPTFGADPAVHAPEVIGVRGKTDDELQQISKDRGLALDLAEMQTVAAHYVALDRDPTDIELEMIAQTWSEHCSHKTFRADLTVTAADGTSLGPVLPLLKQLRAATDAIAAPWVRSAFVDNAGIVALDDNFDLAIKAETHNHPSAVEPFGGANTGVGGVVRDVLGVSARPIALTDVLCFGPTDLPADDLPDGVLHPRLIRRGVIAGVADYGNKLGVANVAGAIVHDPGFVANPLVFCGCVGVLPTGSNPTSPQAGDRIVVIGGRTGRDGIRGATFSSMTMDATTGEVAGASVQIGDPIVEKGLIDVIVEARDLGLYTAVTDCGAGGLSSSVGELASKLGARVELTAVPRKYPGLEPWEVWLSEAQERMVLAVPDVAPLAAVCARHEVELADIGAFTGDGRLVITDAGEVVADLDMHFLHDGRPPRSMTAVVADPPVPTHAVRTVTDPTAALLALLAHPSIRSNADVLHSYDHEIGGGTVLRPYIGAADDGPADAAVVTCDPSSFALGVGVNVRYGVFDAYAMARACVDEAIRNAVSSGADPSRISLLDNFSWGDPRRPETLGALAEAVRGCCDAALVHRAPFVSGKDSLNNEYMTADGTRRSIPPTLVITALGIVPSIEHTPATDLKQVGNVLVLVGDTFDELRGSHLDAVLDIDGPGVVPQPVPAAAERFHAVHRVISDGLVRACHDLAEGGLAVAVTEMAMGGRLGADVDLASVHPDPVVALFAETSARFVLEVEPDRVDAVLAAVPGARSIGTVTGDAICRFTRNGDPIASLSLADALTAWQGHVPGAEGAS